jgi:hypothetical protein
VEAGREPERAWRFKNSSPPHGPQRRPASRSHYGSFRIRVSRLCENAASLQREARRLWTVLLAMPSASSRRERCESERSMQTSACLTVALGVLLAQLPAAPADAQSTAPWRDPSPHQVRFVAVDSTVRLEVLDWAGSGRPVVFVGCYLTGHIYDRIAPKLTDRFHAGAAVFPRDRRREPRADTAVHRIQARNKNACERSESIKN